MVSRRLLKQDTHYYVIDVITQAYIVLVCPTPVHRGCLDKSGKRKNYIKVSLCN